MLIPTGRLGGLVCSMAKVGGTVSCLEFGLLRSIHSGMGSPAECGGSKSTPETAS